MTCLGIDHLEKSCVEGDLLIMWLVKARLGVRHQRWTMLGTHFLPVADVCSKNQGDGDHVRAGGFDSTLVVASWYFCRSGALPAWGLM